MLIHHLPSSGKLRDQNEGDFKYHSFIAANLKDGETLTMKEIAMVSTAKDPGLKEKQ